MFISGGNFIAGIILLFVYLKTSEVWFLIASVAMFVSAFLYFFIIGKLKKRIQKLKDINAEHSKTED